MDFYDLPIIVCITLITFICFRHLHWKLIGHKGKLPCRTFIILGSGGHTREILEYVSYMSPAVYNPRIYVHSNTDELSRTKAKAVEETMRAGIHHFVRMTRAREVGQSWVSSFFTTVKAMVESVLILLKWEPDLILCTGPGVCLPICVIAKLITFLGIWNIKVIFIESICRVQKLSLTGLLLRPFADGFLVQWEELAQKYKGTKFLKSVHD